MHFSPVPLWLAGVVLPYSGAQRHRHDLLEAEAEAQASKTTCTQTPQASSSIVYFTTWLAVFGWTPRTGGQEACLTHSELWQECGWMILSWDSEELGPIIQPTPAHLC